jgi:excisionase family DNA binding protein
MDERLVEADEVGAALGVSSSTVKAMAKAGRIPVVKLSSRTWRFDLAEVVAALKAQSEAEAGEPVGREGQ